MAVAGGHIAVGRQDPHFIRLLGLVGQGGQASVVKRPALPPGADFQQLGPHGGIHLETIAGTPGQFIDFIDDPADDVFGKDRRRPRLAGLVADDQLAAVNVYGHFPQDIGQGFRSENNGRIGQVPLVFLGDVTRSLDADLLHDVDGPVPQAFDTIQLIPIQIHR